MKVINTRPSPDAAPFTEAIRAAGAEVILSPVMEIRFKDTEAPVEPGEALAFTSANGVRAFARVSADRTLPVYAVGPATALEARAAGFQDVAAAGGDVDSLADLISSSKEQRAILHLAGTEQAGDLIAALAATGVPARRIVLYDAVPIAHLSADARAALAADPENCAVGLFSPRSAVLFNAQAVTDGVEDSLSRALLLAFSEPVAAAALAGRWRAVKIAPARTVEAMAALLRG